MTDTQWQREVSEAIAGSGWTIFTTKCARRISDCYAHVDHFATQRSVTVTVSHVTFPTTADRRDEIRRQLTAALQS